MWVIHQRWDEGREKRKKIEERRFSTDISWHEHWHSYFQNVLVLLTEKQHGFRYPFKQHFAYSEPSLKTLHRKMRIEVFHWLKKKNVRRLVMPGTGVSTWANTDTNSFVLTRLWELGFGQKFSGLVWCFWQVVLAQLQRYANAAIELLSWSLLQRISQLAVQINIHI